MAGHHEIELSVQEPIGQPIPFQLLAYWVAVSDGRNPDVMGLDDPRYFRARASFGI